MEIKQIRKRPALSSLSIGGATYDLFLEMQEGIPLKENTIALAIGGKLPVKRVVECTGGGACNTSVGLSRLGLRAGFCGIVGSDQWGEKLLTTLMNERVNVTPATIVEGETSSFSIILTLEGGERTILYAPGVNEHLHDVTFDTESIHSTDVLYLNHLSETACAIEDDLIEAIIGRPEVHLTWNPGGCQIAEGIDANSKAAILKQTDVLLLNREEALAFTRSTDIDDAFALLERAGPKHICITDGKNGSIGSSQGKRFHCPVLPDVDVIETTGAGDAFGIGVTWGCATGLSLQESLMAGTLNAASVVGRIGAQAGLLTTTQMRERLSHCPIRVSEIN
ncbi:MAG: carbohydrate kinase family protein [Candidatus Peribacteraceae bacterium]|nr:carbohydrate kinase family protein [Candidatus Peribacteraceae bacterium]